MDEQEQQNNMISNLPLLFANGYPTSLDKITELQLENFIPFMVQCSLGHINLQGKIDCSEPEWWPEDLPFTIPFSKPKKFFGNWMEKMKEVVNICYQFHKSVFLLKFCNDLASYEHASLRFMNNYNSTTSLFDRRSNKLLVTFRNENMSYDQPQRSRKCLLQQKSKNGRQTGQELQQMMVEPAPFDIYLCDNCDAELYSTEAILEHEKLCNVGDDDVILCDTPEPQEENQQQLDPQCSVENNELRIGFLLNFNLQCRDSNKKAKNLEINDLSGVSSFSAKEESFMIIDRNKRMPRRNRAVHSLTRCPTIPLSSPAGQLLLRTTKTSLTPEYLAERLERMERFCHAPLISKSSTKPKYFEKKLNPNNPHCTFKKPQDYSSHLYVFPRRQFSQRRRAENVLFLNSPLMRRCRPISVRLKKITEHEMKCKRTISSTKLNIKLTRDTTRSSNWKISSPSTEIIVDTIDLCSSDDDDNIGDNVHSTELSANGSGENFFSKPISSIPASKVNFSRSRLKKINDRLNTAEVSLIPIHKAALNNCAIKYDKVNMGSSLIKIVSSTTGELTSVSERGSSELYEGNILLSPSATVVAESGIALPKPLRPSVYIFSNYTTNPLAAIVSTTNELVSTTEGTNFRAHNQENHVQTGTGSNNITTKRTANSNTSSTTDWITGTNALSSSFHSGASSSNSQSLSIERDRSSRSQNLVQSFSSPSRIVSIDLTS